jgi:hypothetical protein
MKKLFLSLMLVNVFFLLACGPPPIEEIPEEAEEILEDLSDDDRITWGTFVYIDGKGGHRLNDWTHSYLLDLENLDLEDEDYVAMDGKVIEIKSDILIHYCGLQEQCMTNGEIRSLMDIEYLVVLGEEDGPIYGASRFCSEEGTCRSWQGDDEQSYWYSNQIACDLDGGDWKECVEGENSACLDYSCEFSKLL